MSRLSDSTVDRLREVVEWPDVAGTKYEIVEKIASGGMGTVYVARDLELGRRVALKVLAVPDAGRAAAARMLREARTLARLEHPGIVPVHDVGTLGDGRVYYAMKLVRGGRLDEYARRTESTAELLRVFGRICEAVAFAHAHGVIHRDLKPANVMVGPFGEVLVMDWGVAKSRGEGRGAKDERAAVAAPSAGTHAGDAVTDVTDLTEHGTVIGTPGYMAPEQAAGEVALVDERADVYALGAVLQYLLTRPAEERGAPTPRPLSAICRKAMAPTPTARYQRVEELAADVAAFLEQRPVSAHSEGLLERAGRVASKYRAPILLVVAYLLMRVVLLALSDR